ncbi:hypothetical protein VKT23_000256 [Stygiomarasmius scandens]|uniref:Uncharacterized protein n=1 Tax=Marasmiellus scandens TaxID=2682957 RepID=A0ABR1K3S3_9AGAR
MSISTTNARFATKFEKKAKLFVNKEFPALSVVPKKYCLTFDGDASDLQGSDEYATITAAGAELLSNYINESISPKDYDAHELELVRKVAKKVVMDDAILLRFAQDYIHPELKSDVVYFWFIHLGCNDDDGKGFTAVMEWIIGPLVGAVEQAWYECRRESALHRRRRSQVALSLLPKLKRRIPSSQLTRALGLATRELTTRRRHPLHSPSRRYGMYIPPGTFPSLASPPRRRSARLSGIPLSPSISEAGMSSISSSSPSRSRSDAAQDDDVFSSSGIGSVSAGPSRRRSARLSGLHAVQTLSWIASSASSARLPGWQYHG